VEGKTYMADFSLCLFLKTPVEGVKFFVGIYIPVLDGVDEVIVKESCSCSLQLDPENAVTVPLFCKR
jgi:hypothetical protein